MEKINLKLTSNDKEVQMTLIIGGKASLDVKTGTVVLPSSYNESKDETAWTAARKAIGTVAHLTYHTARDETDKTKQTCDEYHTGPVSAEQAQKFQIERAKIVLAITENYASKILKAFEKEQARAVTDLVSKKPNRYQVVFGFPAVGKTTFMQNFKDDPIANKLMDIDVLEETTVNGKTINYELKEEKKTKEGNQAINEVYGDNIYTAFLKGIFTLAHHPDQLFGAEKQYILNKGIKSISVLPHNSIAALERLVARGDEKWWPDDEIFEDWINGHKKRARELGIEVIILEPGKHLKDIMGIDEDGFYLKERETQTDNGREEETT